MRAEPVDDLQHPPIGHVVHDGQLSDPLGHLGRDLQPRFLRHVAGERHRDRRALGCAVLDEEGLVVARLAAPAFARRRTPAEQQHE
eukprot:5011507-Prymnesium_polylepis.2